MTASEHDLSPALRDKLDKLSMMMKVQRYSPAVNAMLVEHGLIPESDVAELLGEQIGTTQQRRHQGRMPPHYKFRSGVFYLANDIAKAILAGGVAPKARRADAAADLAGAA